MNIFVLSEDPVEAAQMQCDKHVVKMCLETAQILSTALLTADWITDRIILPEPLYKPTHKNHPSVVWARECPGNFNWLIQHGLALLAEYKYRYKKNHASGEVIRAVAHFAEFSGSLFYQKPRTAFALCMPDQYKCDDPTMSYQAYYIHEKGALAKWTRRNEPHWWS